MLSYGAISAGSTLKPTFHLSHHHTMDYCGVHHDCVHQRVMAEGSRSERQRGGRRDRSQSQMAGTVLSVPFQCGHCVSFKTKRIDHILNKREGAKRYPRDGTNRKWAFTQTVAIVIPQEERKAW